MADDDLMRIIVIKDGERIVAELFGGVVSAGDGTVKVGDIKVGAGEVKGVLALTLSGLRDELAALVPDPDKREQYIDRLLNDPEQLQHRQELFGVTVDVYRAMSASTITAQ